MLLKWNAKSHPLYDNKRRNDKKYLPFPSLTVSLLFRYWDKMAHKHQETKKYIPSLEVGEYEQYKKKQIKKGGWSWAGSTARCVWLLLCCCRSLPSRRGGSVRASPLRPAAAPARLQEEREEAEGLRELRRQPRLRGSRGEAQPTGGARQTGLVLHQEPSLPLPLPR